MQHPRNMHLMHAHTRLEGIRRLPLALTSIQKAREATCGVHPSTRQLAEQKRTSLWGSPRGRSGCGPAFFWSAGRGGCHRRCSLSPGQNTSCWGLPRQQTGCGPEQPTERRWGGCHRRCSPSSSQTIGCWGLPRQQTGCGPEQPITRTWGGCHRRCSPAST